MNFEKVKKVKQSKPFTVLDVILVVIAVVAIGASAVAIYRLPTYTVTVSAPDYERTFSLDKDADIALEHITVHVKDGKVWVTDADCPDKTCVHTGVIGSAGQKIVCLPNRIVISIGGNSDLQWELGR